jgi:uncharacterized protein YjbJ (UPF0337 family)
MGTMRACSPSAKSCLGYCFDHSKGKAMNKDQVKGAAKDTAGKAQEQFGKATGNAEQEAKGDARQVEGKVQKNVGDVKEKVKDAFRKP